MSRIEMFLKELNQEAIPTRKILAALPTDKLWYKPHPKSMTAKVLATHIAELPSWISIVMTTDELDFAKTPYQPTEIEEAPQLLELFERCLAEARTHLIPEKEKLLSETWTLRSGETIFSSDTKADNIRHTLNQIIHHRAQLGVYLRLNDIPVPSTYGPSADDPGI